MPKLTVIQEIKKFNINLIQCMPFYGHALYIFANLRETERVPIAGTTGKEILINSKNMSKYTPENIRFIALHELLHVVYLHPFRRGDRDIKLWNIVCDAVINARIRENIIGSSYKMLEVEELKNGVRIEYSLIKDYSEERLYEIFSDVDSNGSDGSPLQNGVKDILDKFGSMTPEELKDNLIGDIMKKTGMSSEDAKEVVGELIKASELAKMAGQGNLDDIVPFELYGKTKIKWYNYLKKYLTRKLSCERRLSRPDKRFLHCGLTLPGKVKHDKALEGLLVVFDLSGSIVSDEKFVNEFFFQLSKICNQFELEGRLLTFTSEICSDVKINNKTNIKDIEVTGDGGTDFNCVTDYVKQNNINYTCAVICTDGYFSPVPKELHDSIWVLTPDGTRDSIKTGKIIDIDK